MDQKVIDDLREAKSSVERVGVLLNDLYYHSDFSTVFNRPVLSMLIDAARYLSSNLGLLGEKYASGLRR